MQLLPDWAPNIHPMIVHFPIALLLAAIVFDATGLFLKRFNWLAKAALTLYVIGVLMLVITFFTGQSAADGLDIPSKVIPSVSDHADWAETTLWFFIIFTIVRLSIAFWFKSLNKAVLVIVVLIGFVGGYFLFNTAEHGAKLVFGHGLGTGNITVKMTKPQTEQKEKDTSPQFSTEDDGSWKIEASSNAVSILDKKFRWIESSADDASLMYDEENSALMLHPSDKLFFVYDNKIKSVEASADIKIDDLSGEVRLVHHFIDKNNYDFLKISKKEIALGRLTKGEEKIFEKSSLKKSGWINAKVVADGSHFRGYINNKLLVHGHSDAPEDGSVGILSQGSGIFYLRNFDVKSLR